MSRIFRNPSIIRSMMPKPQKIKEPSTKHLAEKDIERDICTWLELKNITYWRIKIKGDPTLTAKGIVFKKNKNVGFSDILVCYKGKMVCLEVKKHGGVCSPAQIEMQIKVRKSGGIYEFVTSKEQVEAILRF